MVKISDDSFWGRWQKRVASFKPGEDDIIVNRAQRRALGVKGKFTKSRIARPRRAP